MQENGKDNCKIIKQLALQFYDVYITYNKKTVKIAVLRFYDIF